MCVQSISQWSEPVSGIKVNPFLTPTLPSPRCSYSQEQPIFLQLKDYFWVKTPSAYELPYGTKGSGKYPPGGRQQWAHLGHTASCSWPSSIPVPRHSARLRRRGWGRESRQPLKS